MLFLLFQISLIQHVQTEEGDGDFDDYAEESEEFSDAIENHFLTVSATKNREDDLEDVWAMRSWDGEVQWDDDVALLNGRNFHRFVQQVPHVLVQFFAPWCGHCQKFEPVYRRAASHLRMEVRDL